MQTAVAVALMATLFLLTPTARSNGSEVGGSWQSLARDPEAVSYNVSEAATVASTLQAALLKTFADWDTVNDTASEDDQVEPDSQQDTTSGQNIFSLLQQILDHAKALLHAPMGCRSGDDAGDEGDDRSSTSAPPCPAAAPELLQGSTLSFLTSLLRTYPGGPTSQEALAAWTAAAIAFLQEHHRLQVQQRWVAQRAADAETVEVARAQVARTAAEAEAEAPAADTDPTLGGAAVAPSQPFSSAAGTGRSPRYPEHVELEEQLQQQHRWWRQRHQQRLLNTRLADAAAAGGDSAPGNTRDRHGKIDRSRTDDGSPGGDGSGGCGGRRTLSSDDPWVSTSNSRHRRTLSEGPGVPVGGLPLVRRVLLAQLLLGWATGLRKELPASTEGASSLAQVFSTLYYIHVNSVVDRAALEYFHISKAGGTSWIVAAKANGCSIPRAKAARTPEFDDNCRWFDPAVLLKMGFPQSEVGRMLICPRYGMVKRRSELRDCSRRLDHFRHQGLHFTANEYTLHGGLGGMHGTHICPQFVTVATIREPLERLLSNIRYMMVQLKRDRAILPSVFIKHFCNRSASDWELYTPPVADNYNIRTLVGERAFHTPLYGIGESHEAVAKQLLLQYDLVLDLNAGSHAAARLMRAGLGWNTTLANVHIWTSEKLAKKGSLDFELCPLGDVGPLLSRQIYDQRWYSFGRTLGSLDQLLLSTAVHLGLKPWPQDWEERQLGPPPLEEDFVRAECGLVGLVPH